MENDKIKREKLLRQALKANQRMEPPILGFQFQTYRQVHKCMEPIKLLLQNRIEFAN